MTEAINLEAQKTTLSNAIYGPDVRGAIVNLATATEEAWNASLPIIDETLTQSGQAADAAVVGSAISDMQTYLGEIVINNVCGSMLLKGTIATIDGVEYSNVAYLSTKQSSQSSVVYGTKAMDPTFGLPFSELFGSADYYYAHAEVGIAEDWQPLFQCVRTAGSNTAAPFYAAVYIKLADGAAGTIPITFYLDSGYYRMSGSIEVSGSGIYFVHFTQSSAAIASVGTFNCTKFGVTTSTTTQLFSMGNNRKIEQVALMTSYAFWNTVMASSADNVLRFG